MEVCHVPSGICQRSHDNTSFLLYPKNPQITTHAVVFNQNFCSLKVQMGKYSRHFWQRVYLMCLYCEDDTLSVQCAALIYIILTLLDILNVSELKKKPKYVTLGNSGAL